MAACVVLLIAAGVWIGWHALSARRALTRAKDDLTALRVDLAHGRLGPVPALLSEIRMQARAADADTHDPVWAAASYLPIVGAPLTSFRGISAVVAGLSTGALPEIASAADVLNPAHYHLVNGTLRLAPLEQAATPLGRAAVEVAAATRQVAALPSSTVLSPVDQARDRLLTEMQTLNSDVGHAAVAARVGPAMLGAGGPREYFVAFETEAELRGTGGLPGAFAIIRADHGHLSLVRVGSDSDLPGTGPAAPVSLPASYYALYNDDATTSLWANSDMSPDFPTVAKIWMGLWRVRAGVHLDGAFAVDPQTLADVLRVVGPVTVPGGRQITAGNAVPFTEQQAYAQFGPNAAARKAYLVDVAHAVLERLLHGSLPNPAGLLRALGTAIGERRLLGAAATGAEESGLASTPLGGELPSPSTNTLGVFLNNGAGSKLDYYLTERVRWRQQGCANGVNRSHVTISLHSSAPASGLPAEAQQHLGPQFPPDMDEVYVQLYTPGGAAATDATVDGRPSPLYAEYEGGHPVFFFSLDVYPGRSATAEIRLDSLARPGPAAIVTGPMVHPAVAMLSGHSCR